ncbi:MAG: PEP-CTERM sorting domain-containing protein [Armatimonadota bacterium]
MKIQFRQFKLLCGGIAILFSAGANASELLISNFFGNSIVRFDPTTGTSLGSYTGGSLNGALGMSVGPNGLLYVCSEGNNSIQRFNMISHAFVDTIISGSNLNGPTGITFDSSNNILVGNFNNDTVTKYNSSGTFLSSFVTAGTGGINGLYVPSFESNAIQRYNATTGAFVDTFIPAGVGGMSQPRTILFRDNKVWVTSDNGNKVLRYGLDGSFIDTFVTAGSGGLSGASGMTFGDDGLLYVSSWRNNRILKYSMTDGSFAGTALSTGLSGPTFIMMVPEPTTIMGIGLGIAALAIKRRKQTITK